MSKNSTLRKTPYIYGLGTLLAFFIIGMVGKGLLAPSAHNPVPEMYVLAGNFVFWVATGFGAFLGLVAFFREKQKHAERQEVLDAINAKKESAE